MYKIQTNSTNNITNYDKQTNFSGIDQTKQQLINFIYKNVNLSSYKYDTLEVESELSLLVSKTYYVSANFSGSNCLLIFTKIKDKFHTCLIDRKTLSFNPNKINLQNVKITPVNIKVKNTDIYKGTILDGTFVTNKNIRTFIITDVYMFKGDDYSKSQLESKLLSIRTFLDSNFIEDKSNNLEIHTNKTFPIDKTEHLINNVIPKIKNFLIRGICFYPEISGTKLLFKFGNENVQSNQTTQTTQITQVSPHNKSNYTINNVDNINNKDNSSESSNSFSNTRNKNNRSNSSSPIQSVKSVQPVQTIIPKAPEVKKITKVVYIPKDDKNDNDYVFEMKRTEKIDVYKLMALDTIIKDGKKMLKRIQICLAYIPNMDRSKWCKEIIEKNGDNVLVTCKFHKEKFKWEPVNISTAKKPSFIKLFNIKTID